MLHGSECWAVTRETTLRMQRNDRAMMRWICNVRLTDQVNSDILLARLNIPNLKDILRQGRLRWFGHVHRSDGWIKKCTEMEMVGRRASGRPKKSWKEVIAHDRKEWKLNNVDPGDRNAWRSSVKKNIIVKSTPT